MLSASIDQYRNLRQLKISLVEQLDLVTTQCCIYFVTIEISKSVPIQIEFVTDIICNRYTKRFIKNTSTTPLDDWRGYYKYTYTDFLFDEKYSSKCIVVNETECYVLLWYYENNPSNVTVKKRIKTDSRLKNLISSILDR